MTARRHVEPRAWAGDLPRTVDSVQERLGQGPCLDAVCEQQVVRVDDVAAEERRPSSPGRRLGVGSMMSFAYISQEVNRKSSDIARELTDPGAVPGPRHQP